MELILSSRFDIFWLCYAYIFVNDIFVDMMNYISSKLKRKLEMDEDEEYEPVGTGRDDNENENVTGTQFLKLISYKIK